MRCLALGLLLLPLTLLPARPPEAAPASTPPRVDFSRDVRPIFSNHCFACHGPDEQQRKANLRLDSKTDAFKPRKRGPLIVPGQPDQSPLLERICTNDEARQMPPPEFGKPLKPDQIALLRRWIAEGAEWKDHWAYRPQRRPALPPVKLKQWPRNPVDQFILAELEKQGLSPSPEADKLTLLRRVTLDLTGLPPTIEEQQAFLLDNRPDAYERVIDRLLASPRYGERWAVHWLDLARYADTNGYHIDNHRDMWLYRDWVINALNANMPFDRFTLEQLAGDLLPNATTEQRIASGFQRNVMVNFEGGADPNEYLTKYIVDRVNTLGTVWLGSTLACAECHDHKYDPFTQKDFYQLYAFFHNVPEQGLDGQKDNPKPFLKVPNPEQARKKEALAKDLAATEKQIEAELAKVPMPAVKEGIPTPRHEFVWLEDDLPSGTQPQGTPDPWKWATASLVPVHSGQRSHTRTATGLSQHFFENAPAPLRVGGGDQFFASVYLDPKNPPAQVMLQFNDGTWEHRVYWGESKIDWGKDKTVSRLHAGPLPPTGRWVRLSVKASAVGLPPGSLVKGMAFTQFGGTVTWDRAGIHSSFSQADQPLADFATWLRWERQNLRSMVPEPEKGLTKKPADKRSPEEMAKLWRYYLRRVAPQQAAFASLNQREDQLRKELAEVEAAIPATMVMMEQEKPRDTHILMRGDFQQKGTKVEPGLPSFLPGLPKDAKRDRLSLAKWLVSPDHPLTSRVTVNRYWEQLFGQGLVKTTEEFGAQGEWPSHPELLEWLAVEFREPTSAGKQPWDVKSFLRLLVTSATYRQSTRVTPELLAKDPQNRLFARGPRFRLPAEFIRDQALFVSGLMDPRMGGPSVRPYQPPGLWEAVAFGGEFSSQTYVQSKGADLYRRGLYIYWKRSLPHPSLFAFDAPNRELCCDRRPRTNTPLQALTLLNDPIYVEAARKLAERILKEGGSTDTARLDFAARLCLTRSLERSEAERLTALLAKLRGRFGKEPKAAAELLKVGESPRDEKLDAVELAVWTALANALFNLDEMVTKG